MKNNSVIAECSSSSHPQAQGSVQDVALMSQVEALKARLEPSHQLPTKQLLETLEASRALGDIPTKIFKNTGIGLAVAQISKDASAEGSVLHAAKSLKDKWVKEFRKSVKRAADEDVGYIINDRSPPKKQRQSCPMRLIVDLSERRVIVHQERSTKPRSSVFTDWLKWTSRS